MEEEEGRKALPCLLGIGLYSPPNSDNMLPSEEEGYKIKTQLGDEKVRQLKEKMRSGICSSVTAKKTPS